MNATANSTSMTRTFIVYAIIMGIAIFQVCFAMLAGPQPILMLPLAFVQAAIAVMYFMHLAQERRVLALALIPYTIYVLIMMNMFWPDSVRLLHLRPH